MVFFSALNFIKIPQLQKITTVFLFPAVQPQCDDFSWLGMMTKPIYISKIVFSRTSECACKWLRNVQEDFLNINYMFNATQVIALMPNVLKVFLENGQTKSFKYDSSTTVQVIIESRWGKL